MRLLGVSARLEWRSVLAYRVNLVFQVLGVGMTSFLMVAFWRSLYATRPEINGFDLGTMIVYALSSILVSILFGQGTEGDVANSVYSGDIGTEISRPRPYPLILFTKAIARGGVNALTRALPYLLAVFCCFRAFGMDLPSLSPLAIPSFILSFCLNFLYQFIFGILAFWTMEISGVLYAREFLMLGLSGSFIPLWFFPDWLYAASAYMPFRFIYHSPLSIAVGKIAGSGAFMEIALQAVWNLVMGALAFLLWRSAVKRVVVNGG